MNTHNGGYQSHVFPTSTSLGSSNILDLFALVIGIDKYNNPDYLPLSGSVTDANAVEDYLTSKLRVPKSHIISLRNESATRSAIIQALESDLLLKFRRGTGCPVLIYFAGHGGEIDAPHGWPCSSGKIQMLIPYDCGCLLPQGNTVVGIPDYTLAKHLMNLAKRKGDNNILVILDSCFSGTATRSISDNYGPGVRAVKYRGSLPELPASPTQNQSTVRVIKVDPLHALSGLKSHTLLAACKSDEYAREANKHGVFTDALLKTLSKVDITKTTYKELLRKLPQLSSNQNPQCEGQQQDCIIFSTRIKAPHNGNPCEPDPNRSVLYVGVRQRIQVVMDAIRHMHMPPESDIVLAETPDIAHISIEDENRQLCFYVHDINVNHYGLYKLPHAISHYATETNLQGILRRIAFYEHHLRRVKTPSNIDGKVSLEFLRVGKQPEAGVEQWAYVGNILPNDLAIGGQINLVQDGSLYVIKLTNTTSRDLYPSLFYFDNCDYSIESLYEPPSPGGHGDGDAPLKAGRSMVIGYGSEGVCPFVLEVDVRNPASAEIGFLKLFISTKHTDYSHIRQYSPFREPPQHAQTQTRGLKDYTRRRKEYFGSILVPLIVQSQYNPSARGTARGLGEHSLAPPSESNNRTVFKQVMVQRHHRRGLLEWFRGRLGHSQPHQSQSTEMSQIEQQFANINMLDEPYLQSALRELTEMGSDIEELKAGISQLKVEKEQDRSSEELGALKQRIRQMEATTGVRGGYPDN
ncbi:hypothetical protein BDN70DRAFT_920403 [Pholiota conissans]|uniref:Peptidase C14 caspase domain-containing protein n=1 Tax=Pholiota conissans TaxID=109636 RepID=A0A9P6CUK4_9AGAR|nr:hypothetical protein BDN70DRAFT_920403 [Pholiota conissans]